MGSILNCSFKIDKRQSTLDLGIAAVSLASYTRETCHVFAAKSETTKVEHEMLF